MREGDAAAYLSIGATMLREEGPKPKKVRGCTVWDRRDLDRWADALDGQPLSEDEAQAESRDAEDRFLRKREAKRG